MASSLLLALLFLTPTTVVNPKTEGPCPACWGAIFDLESQRELLLDLAKKSILDKLHLSQRPILSRPVSRGALKTALQRLRGPRRETLLEHDTGRSMVRSSGPKPDPRKEKVSSLVSF